MTLPPQFETRLLDGLYPRAQTILQRYKTPDGKGVVLEEGFFNELSQEAAHVAGSLAHSVLPKAWFDAAAGVKPAERDLVLEVVERVDASTTKIHTLRIKRILEHLLPGLADSAAVYVLHPRKTVPGGIAVVARGEAVPRVERIEQELTRRVFRIRAVVAAGVYLDDDLLAALGTRAHTRITLGAPSLHYYVHHGGSDVVYLHFVAGADGKLDGIDVDVETDRPSEAFSLARKPINEFLDYLALNHQVPVTIARLDLFEEGAERAIAHQLVMPFEGRLQMGDLGGIHVSPLFSPFLGLIREGLMSTSPFYRFLCGYRAYEGVNQLRKALMNLKERFSVQAPLPKMLKLDPTELEEAGIPRPIAEKSKTLADFVHAVEDLRNGVAHFLLQGDAGDEHVDVGAGAYSDAYSPAGGALLKFVSDEIRALRAYYSDNIERHLAIGSVLPRPEDARKYRVRDPRF